MSRLLFILLLTVTGFLSSLTTADAIGLSFSLGNNHRYYRNYDDSYYDSDYYYYRDPYWRRYRYYHDDDYYYYNGRPGFYLNFGDSGIKFSSKKHHYHRHH